jgi:acetolactate synthase I/II/III large subunit
MPASTCTGAASPKDNSPPRSGAQRTIEILKSLWADTVFGVIGAATMPLYDVIHGDQGFNHIMVAHEQGGVHMAEGYAKALGRPGVVMATSGPGTTNLITGLANAMLDSTPLVALTGQVATTLIGRDAFQEVDTRGLASPITKHAYQPHRPQDLPGVLAEAFHLASSGRPGPVLVDLPKDVALAQSGPGEAAKPHLAGVKPVYKGHPLQIKRALALLKEAARPMILMGGGVLSAEAWEEVFQLAEALDIPVASTLMGLSGFPGDHPLFLGLAGMHGLGPANLALHGSDLILCLGSRLSDRLTGRTDRFAPKAKLIQVDIDPSEIGKNLPTDIPIVGHLRPVLRSLIKAASSWEARPDLSGWHREIGAWRQRYPMTYQTRGDRIAPQQVVETVDRLLDEEAIVTTGVGQHQMYTAQFYRFQKPRTFITSGGLGTMGFGLPAAIGAQIGLPDSRVVCLDGDGSFMMTIQELATAVRYRIPVTTVVLNNSALGMVKQWQTLFLDQRTSETGLILPQLDRVARSFGALGKRVERPEELEPALTWAFQETRRKRLPAVIDVRTDPDSIVLPMVPAGASNADFIPCQKEKS